MTTSPSHAYHLPGYIPAPDCASESKALGDGWLILAHTSEWLFTVYTSKPHCFYWNKHLHRLPLYSNTNPLHWCSQSDHVEFVENTCIMYHNSVWSSALSSGKRSLQGIQTFVFRVKLLNSPLISFGRFIIIIFLPRKVQGKCWCSHHSWRCNPLVLRSRRCLLMTTGTARKFAFLASR